MLIFLTRTQMKLSNLPLNDSKPQHLQSSQKNTLPELETPPSVFWDDTSELAIGRLHSAIVCNTRVAISRKLERRSDGTVSPKAKQEVTSSGLQQRRAPIGGR